MPREIERKWIIDSIEIPEYELLEELAVEQAYISVNPELRIRNKGGVFFTLTIKDNGDIDRVEVEIPITEEQYKELLNKVIGKQPIRKRYRRYQLPSALVLEVSEVDDGAFIYAEVEFPSLEAAAKFNSLSVFLEEVSTNSYYRMRTYWQRTRI